MFIKKLLHCNKKAYNFIINMNKTFKTGNNLVEYTIILLLGFMIGYALWNIKPSTFRNYFKVTFFSNNTVLDSHNNLTVEPIGSE